MSRRNAQLPWGQRSRNVYGQQRRPVGRIVLLAAIGVATLALAYFVFTTAFGSESCSNIYCPSDQTIATPEGYERVTKVFDYNKAKGEVPAGNNVVVGLPLQKPTTDGRNLSFYKYNEVTKAWESITPALLDAQGKQASATLTTAPPVIAVMRRLSPAGYVVAYLPRGQSLSPEANGRITILHTRDFAPASDGTIVGEPSGVKTDGAYAWYPTIWADGTEKGQVPAVSSILSNAASRSNHVQQILKKVQDLQLGGIDIAYMDLPATDRTSFTLFVNELAGALHAQNKVLTLTLPVPVKTPERIDDGAYDWAELGKAADVLQMTPYRDQGTYRTVMPEILQQLTSQVEPSKLVLTVTPYATEKSSEGIRTLTLVDAMVIATKIGVSGNDPKLTTNTNVDIAAINIDKTDNLSGLVWSPEAASVAFTYRQNVPKTVWIENLFSIGFKLDFISRYKLGGVAVEDASSNEYLGDIWPALVPFITSGQAPLLQPNPQDLLPQWQVSKGATEGGSRGVLRWVTPSDPGTYTIKLTLSDGVAQFVNEIPVTVQAKAQTPVGTGTPGQ
ncbi:MAG: hypothetical protein HYX53_03745 [Chloroflexi bacterium]|nr:hypothetical protein [Chloroflexota bacterium]